MIDPTTRIRRNPDVVFRPLEEEQGGVLLHLQSGAYHGLNQFGSLIWGLIENETRFADLVDGVRAESEDCAGLGRGGRVRLRRGPECARPRATDALEGPRSSSIPAVCGSFVDPSGRSVTSATIAPHSGAIFTN